MKSSLIAFLLAVLAQSSFAQEYVMPQPLIVGRAGNRVTIPQKNSDGPHDFFSDASRGGIEFTVLHSSIKKNGRRYIVFTCDGWSKGGENRNGRCGAGWEKQINWMVIKDGIIVEHQRRDIVSCWQDVDGEMLGWKGSLLFWNSNERDGWYECFYDATNPEKGLQILKHEKAEPSHPANPRNAGG
jgi:hypothetical protein